ncbi:hypothetical protein GF373_07375 [bacterium]|nr:hypothetical protein [bacterium]
MNKTETLIHTLEATAQVLIRAFILGLVFLLIWFAVFCLMGDWAYNLHSTWFDLTRQQFHIIHYCGMGFLKIILFTFFLIPYTAIRLILLKH